MNAVSVFLGFLKKSTRGRIFFVLVLMTLHSATEGISLLLIVPLLGTLADGANESQGVQFLLDMLDRLHIPPNSGGILGAFVVLIILRSIIQLARDRQEAVLQHDVVNALRFSCFQSLLQAEWRWILTQSRSDHINLVMGEVSRVGSALNAGLRLSAATVAILIYLATAFIVSPEVAAFLVAVGAIIFLLLTRLRRQAHALGTKQGHVNRSMVRNIQESLGGLKLAKILGTEQKHLEKLVDAVEGVRNAQLGFALNVSLVRASQQVLGAIILALYIFFGIVWFDVPIPELLALVVIFSRILPQFTSVQQVINQLLHIVPAIHEVDTFLKESQQAAEPIAEADTQTWQVQKQISLQSISLQYEGRDTAALDTVSMTFPVNTTTALIGRSGSGKSTLADIVMGLVVADSGHLKIDDQPVGNAERKRWMRSVSYVPQEVILFHDTIRENLLWGNPTASEETLNDVLHKSAAEFVFQLPDGLNTIVGDNGMRLSGGEKQRIALARALLRRPSLLILDEATSALDMENESRVLKAIENLRGDLTVLLIGHRLAALDQADQIITLSNGTIEKIQSRDTPETSAS